MVIALSPGGHYVAFAKNAPRNSWFEFNDTRVRPVSADTVLGAEGYVLFYRSVSTLTHAHMHTHIPAYSMLAHIHTHIHTSMPLTHLHTSLYTHTLNTHMHTLHTHHTQHTPYTCIHTSPDTLSHIGTHSLTHVHLLPEA